MSWLTLLAIGSGGFFGAISRAYLNGLVNAKLPHLIPFGTLSVNLLGSFIMGILFILFANLSVNVHTKSLLTTGFLGALTTYSTFAIESFLLIHAGSFILAGVNMFMNLVGTILFVSLGYYIGSFFFK